MTLSFWGSWREMEVCFVGFRACPSVCFMCVFWTRHLWTLVSRVFLTLECHCDIAALGWSLRPEKSAWSGVGMFFRWDLIFFMANNWAGADGVVRW